ncbi:Acid protease [Mycena sanguinolenta]|uniref:Acid protease n=1 Tax=Mycena sanguinolenta TaxID=230812 RepID=A0A8H7DIY3_9AGAR|nr:Acid protease [Mycena sanguinolenta]
MVFLTASFLLVSLVYGALSTAVAPRGVHSVPIYKKVSGNTTSIKALIARDLVRFNVDAAAAVGEAPATNEDNSYVTSTQVGTQTFELLVDTGSSNTWVGAGTAYTPGSTATDTGDKFFVEYGSGEVCGTEYIDNVVIGGLHITGQGIGSAIISEGFTGVDGHVFLSTDTISPADRRGTVVGAETVPTVMDNLFSQRQISAEVLGVSFAPENGGDTDDANGELTLGGTDPTKYSGPITYVHKTTASPFNQYWGIAVTGMTYGGASISASANAIVDTGTTLIFLPDTAYTSFLSASGGETDVSTGVASWSTLPKANLVFTIGGVSFSLTPSQFTIPAAQYADWGLPAGKFYGWISNGGSLATGGINFIIGQKFLENYYSVFDTTNNQVGLAPRA